MKKTKRTVGWTGKYWHEGNVFYSFIYPIKKEAVKIWGKSNIVKIEVVTREIK